MNRHTYHPPLPAPQEGNSLNVLLAITIGIAIATLLFLGLSH